MGRIAATEDVEGIRDEQDVAGSTEAASEENTDTEAVERDTSTEQPVRVVQKPVRSQRGKYVATLQEVHEAFDSVNVLRYSQPCHLQGISYVPVLRI